MAVNEWWVGDPAEIYFLETTDRTDIGVDLNAPQADDAGRAHHAYALVPHVRDGDVIFHYQQPHGLVGWSRAIGAPYMDAIVWGARGRVAQKAGVQPYTRPGWRVALEGPFLLQTPVSLATLRAAEPAIRQAIVEAEESIVGTLYRPFQISDKQPLRATQHYLTKLPLSVILAVPPLIAAADEAGNAAASMLADPRLVPPQVAGDVGQPYIPADAEAATAQRDPFTIDPGAVDRGLRGHASTQNALAERVRAVGAEPRSPSAREPQYDLSWTVGETLFVAEVKSLTPSNEERQLRLGLGQVLRYRHLLGQSGVAVSAVLAVEQVPSDPTWVELCRALGVTLCWPPGFDAL